MRIALISDIHGNQLALEAVMGDAKRRQVDRVVCLGDTATLGPRPREVLATLRDLGCPCILGNHDAFLLDPALVARYTRVPVIVQAIDRCREQLTEADIAFIRTFREEHYVPLPGDRRLYLFHGSPDSNTRDVLATTPSDDLDALLGDRRASVMAGGHTHIQMLRQHRGTWLVNPGSVGMPFREYVSGARPEIMPHAEYAIVDASADVIGVELLRVPLDKERLRAEVRAWASAPVLLQADLLAQYA
jgi:putative phosphoesterase